jgi:GNAT superfamily N-acetyltransferase
MALQVRAAVLDDVQSIADVLGDAFLDNPWTRWTVDPDDHAHRLRAIHTTYLTAMAIPYGRVDVTEIDGVIVASAVWLRAGAPVPESVWTHVDASVSGLYGNRAAAAAAAEALLAPHRPTTAHMTLATIGVRRDLHGRGIGTATLRPGLRAADAGGMITYLETSTDRNVRLYSCHGFVVTAAVDLPDGGPRTWCMRRDPAPRE